MKKFEAGKMYGSVDGRFDPIKVFDRTEKTVVVGFNFGEYDSCRKKIRYDCDGNEQITDGLKSAWYAACWNAKKEC